jgi:predicted lipid-binding transport protein (Tim44 family)
VQALELLISAVLAGIVLYQLYAVLGRRVGRQPEDEKPVATAGPTPFDKIESPVPVDDTPLSGLAAVRARDPSFNVGHFLNGSKTAYEFIVKAFAAGDRAALEGLLAPHILTGFVAVIDQRAAEGRTEVVEFIQAPRADLESIDLNGHLVTAKVRFLAEFRSRTQGPEGEGVDDRRTAEVWTFARPVASANPNWILTRVDAAQA